jgi:serine/threonine-protein kinase
LAADDERASGLYPDSALRNDAHDAQAARALVVEEGAVLAGKYRLTRTAGFGGMAQLWVATNLATGAEVCIKILVPEGSDGDSVERFRREAYAAARLSHRAIVKIFDLVELGPTGEALTDGSPTALAIVMELLHGETLADLLMKKGKLPLDEAMDLAVPFLSALAHAHRAGVVHRDLKPDNVFLATEPDGHVIPKVLDFGVSKMSQGAERDPRTGKDQRQLTYDGVVLGTPSYMSPEQARGSRSVDARSDVFSAGILMYMMLAGKNPFESETFHLVISAILEREPPRPEGVPDAIWAVIEKALTKDPALRFADATELGIALRRATGRTSTTDSGAHLRAALPASVRTIVTPLGGDSLLTVPPIGNAELGDEPAVLPLEGSPARRRATRVVVGVLAASVAIVAVAAFRSLGDSSSGARPPETRLTAPATATAASTAAPPSALGVTPSTTAATPAGAMANAATPEAVKPSAPAVTPDAGAIPAPGVAALPSPAARTQEPTPLPPPKTSSSGARAPAVVKRGPSIVRDPGF